MLLPSEGILNLYRRSNRNMSQEKVDRYKKEKADRKQTMKKEKVQNVLRKSMVGIVAV